MDHDGGLIVNLSEYVNFTEKDGNKRGVLPLSRILMHGGKY